MCKLRYWGMPSPCSSLFFSTMTWYKNAIMDFSALRHLLLQWVLIVTMVTVDMSQPCSSLFTVPLENSFIVVCALQQLLAKTCVFLCRSLCSRFFFFWKQHKCVTTFQFYCLCGFPTGLHLQEENTLRWTVISPYLWSVRMALSS